MPASTLRYSSCCRLCLDTNSNTLAKLFSDTYGEPVADLIYSLLGIQISVGDKLTTLLCTQCHLLIQNWSVYRTKCLENQSQLNRWFDASHQILMNQSLQIKEEPEDVIIIDSDHDEEDEINHIRSIKREPTSSANIPIATTPDMPPPLSPNLPINVDVPISIDEVTTNGCDLQADKEDFAAGLELQTRRITQSEPFTETEKCYLTKYRLIFSVYNSLTCLCHNQKYVNSKAVINHMRNHKESAHFGRFKCYNCLITFDCASKAGRHRYICTRPKFEATQRVINLLERPKNKYRLYQDFICKPCQYIFTFYEDYVAHLQEVHVKDSEANDCLCGQRFDPPVGFLQHILKSCYTNYYCDICLQSYETMEQFKKHKIGGHDETPFLTVHKSFKIYNCTQVGLEVPDNLHKEMEVKDDKIKFIKSKPGKCPICNTLLSNYFCLVKHLTNVHKVNVTTAKSMAAKSYITYLSEKPPELEPADGDSGKPKLRASAAKVNYSEEKDELEAQQSKHICNICDKPFSNAANLARHIRTIHNVKPNAFNCHECPESFRSLDELELHRSEVHTYVCLDCGSKCSSKKNLEAHRMSHLKLSLKKDPKTQSYITSSNNSLANGDNESDNEMPLLVLADNQEDYEPEPKKSIMKLSRCSLCPMQFDKKSTLKDHMDDEHQFNKLVFPKKCDICGMILSKLAAWVNHLKKHKGLYCNPIYRKNHSKEPKNHDDYYTCNKCFKVFTSKSNYKLHMKSHSLKATAASKSNNNVQKDVQPRVEKTKKHKVYCKHCKIPFENDKDMHKHMQEEHGEHLSKQKKYSCKLCKLVAPSNEILQNHLQNVHYNVNKFRCPICNKKSVSATGLSAHMKVHERKKRLNNGGALERTDSPLHPAIEPMVIIKSENVNNLECPVCSKMFSRKDTLRLHMFRMHPEFPRPNEGPLQCPYCDRTFGKPQAFAIHIRVHEKEHDSNANAAGPTNNNAQTFDTNEAPTFKYTCGICHEGFNIPKDLKEHNMLRHPF